MQLTSVLYTDKIDPQTRIFRKYVKASQNFSTIERKTSSDSGLRNDARAIQISETIGRQIKRTYV